MCNLESQAINPRTWADGFGVWHASVPIMATRSQEARAAIGLIRAELLARGEGLRFRVEREHVTNHGTVIYREV